MKSSYYHQIFILVLIPLWTLQSQATYNLEDCYQSALQQSELVKDQKQLLIQSEERTKQSLASHLPSLALAGSYTQLDDTHLSSSLSPASQPLAKLTLSQSLFHGFRDQETIRQSQRQALLQKQNQTQTLNQLYLDVAQNYFSILLNLREIKNINIQISLYDKRLQDVKARVKIGRSKVSELLTVEASLATLKAQLKQVEAALANQRELFAFLTGLNRNSDLEDLKEPQFVLKSLQSYQERAQSRTDLKMIQLRREIAQTNIDIAKDGHLPSLDFSGNYYLVRSGSLKDVIWDLGLTLTFPLYSGGVTESKVREASSQLIQNELAESRLQRQIQQEITSLYQSLQFDEQQIKAYAEAYRLSEANYRQQLQDYKLDLVSNLDVLQALVSFQENNRALDRARYQMALDYKKLEVATTEKPNQSEKE